ncbi:hypothetical protein CYMTET_15213, partial [Cymbomonas tetramitiformis]
TPKYLVDRPVIEEELEKTLTDCPFRVAVVKRGRLNSFETDDVGVFKYLTHVTKLKEVPYNAEGEEPPEEPWKRAKAEVPYAPLLAKLREPVTVVVRLYILRGLKLSPKDVSVNSCDPYLLVELGSLPPHNGRERYIEKTLHPQFHEMVQFTTTLPGMSNMVVSVYDWDKYTSDDLVGKTIIDLEQRWFSEEWQKLTTPTTDSEGNRTAAMMPLERRVLTPSGDSEEQSQGALDMWLEMFHEVEERDNPVMDITPAPPVMVEMRCVVYEARNMTAKDVATLQNDLYIRVIVQGIDGKGNIYQQAQETDTHWLASGGKGSFNYRLVFNLELPLRQPRLRIQAWDRDIVGRSDSIGEHIFSLRSMFSQLLAQVKEGNGTTAEIRHPASKTPLNLGREWFSVSHPSKKGESQGEVLCEFSLMTKERAERKPVGIGRAEPNRDPKLPEPERARLNLMDPMGSLKMLVGPERFNQIIAVLCFVLCLFVGGFILLMVLNDVMAALISSVIE